MGLQTSSSYKQNRKSEDSLFNSDDVIDIVSQNPMPAKDYPFELVSSEIKESPTKSQDSNTIKVYFSPKISINVCLRFDKASLNDLTLRQLIGKCLERLHDEYMLNVHFNMKLYVLSVANKYGKRKQGYPELDLDQDITSTKFKRFYLQDLSKSFSLISRQLNLQKKYGFLAKQKKANEQGVCCTFFQLLKS